MVQPGLLLKSLSSFPEIGRAENYENSLKFYEILLRSFYLKLFYLQTDIKLISLSPDRPLVPVTFYYNFLLIS